MEEERGSLHQIQKYFLDRLVKSIIIKVLFWKNKCFEVGFEGIQRGFLSEGKAILLCLCCLVQRTMC